MSVYQVTIQIDSDTRIERLREVVDRIVLHTFGSSGTVENFIEVDPDADPIEWDAKAAQEQDGAERNLPPRNPWRPIETTWTNPDLEED